MRHADRVVAQMTRRETLFAFAAGLVAAATAQYTFPVQVEARVLPPITGHDFSDAPSGATFKMLGHQISYISAQLEALTMSMRRSARLRSMRLRSRSLSG